MEMPLWGDSKALYNEQSIKAYYFPTNKFQVLLSSSNLSLVREQWLTSKHLNKLEQKPRHLESLFHKLWCPSQQYTLSLALPQVIIEAKNTYSETTVLSQDNPYPQDQNAMNKENVRPVFLKALNEIKISQGADSV